MDKKNWKAPEIEATEIAETANDPYADGKPDGGVWTDECKERFPGYNDPS